MGTEGVTEEHDRGGAGDAAANDPAGADGDPARPVAAIPEGTAHYNLKIIWPLARYVEARHGAEGLRRLAEAAGVRPTELDLKNRWVDWRAFEDLVFAARSLLESDDEFKLACTYRLREAYGPMRYVLWAATPGLVLAQSCKHVALVSNAGELTWKDRGRTRGHMGFKNSVPYSRLTCLIRQTQTVALPTMWGLPPAHMREHACIGLGDATCELEVYWYDLRRWLPVVVGAAGLALAALALARLGVAWAPPPLAGGLFGALLGYAAEGRRVERLNERTGRDVMAAMEDLAREEADTRRDLLEMHARQLDWTRVVEEEIRDRGAAFQKIAAGVAGLEEARATAVLGVSHDLRNPLQIIAMGAEYLRSLPPVMAAAEVAEVVGDLDQSIVRMRRMLSELVLFAKADRHFIPMQPQTVGIAALVESLRGRLRVLAHGGAIGMRVSATREAPATIEVDPLALDRIVDNLLANAVKYTTRGNVAVEIDGTERFVVIKVADTGCGIAPDALARIFRTRGSEVDAGEGGGAAVGLSVVVELLVQLGGRLEVMSSPGAGTTFWVYLPVRREGDERPSPTGEGPAEGPSLPVAPVVTIRDPAGSDRTGPLSS